VIIRKYVCLIFTRNYSICYKCKN